MTGKRLQIFELFLVISIAFLPSIVLSVFALISRNPIYNSSHEWTLTYLLWIPQTFLPIVLMFYVLYRQGKNYSSIGLKRNISATDLLHALGIIFVAGLASGILILPINSFFPDFIKQASNPRNLEFTHTNFTFFLILLAIMNPIKEELIVRGFTMSEILDLNNNKFLAILVSVAIQFSYHLYQGLPSALLLLPYFIISALYFLRFRNLNSVIIAHLLTDVGYLLHQK